MRATLAASLVVVGIAALPARSEALKLGTSGFSPVAPAAPSPVATAAQGKITMKPSAGLAHTHFVVGFTAQQRTSGGVAGTLRRYEVTASTGARVGCQSSAFASVGARRNGEHVTAKLIPRSGGSWCAGSFHGKIIETFQPVCGPGKVCPLFIAVIRTIGTFRFRVKASAGSSTPAVGTSPRPTACVPLTDLARDTCG
jgi:hypothetical protein